MNPTRFRHLAMLLLLLSSVAAHAAGFDDRQALGDLKEVKAAFDLTAGKGKVLLRQLSLIDKTRSSLVAQGVTPRFVLTFRGPASRLVQRDPTKIAPADRKAAAEIAALLEKMRAEPGIEGLQQCSIAMHGQGVKAKDVLPAIKVVGNGWISLIAYQNRGYALIVP